MKVLALVVMAVFLSATFASAGYNPDRVWASKPDVVKYGSKPPTYHDDQGIERIQRSGEIYRNPKVLHDFKRQNPKPTDGREYEAHHVKPLHEGGSDSIRNLKWVEKSEHKRITAEGAKKDHGHRKHDKMKRGY